MSDEAVLRRKRLDANVRPLSPRTHTVHYPVLSAGQASLTFGRGTAVGRLLKVYSTARYVLLDPTEGIGIGSLCLPSPQYRVYTSKQVSGAAPNGVKTWCSVDFKGQGGQIYV